MKFESNISKKNDARTLLCTLCVYCTNVQSNGGVATTPPPYLSTLKTYPNPGEGPTKNVYTLF